MVTAIPADGERFLDDPPPQLQANSAEIRIAVALERHRYDITCKSTNLSGA